MFNRNIVILYLHDLVTLELIKDKLGTNYANIDSTIKRLGIPNQKNYRPMHIWRWWNHEDIRNSILVFFGALLAGWIVNSFFRWIGFNTYFWQYAGYVIAAITFIVGACYVIGDIKTNRADERSVKSDNEKVDKHNAEDDIRVTQELEEKQLLEKKRNEIADEWYRVDTLLKQVYSVNIIPHDKRNIFAVFYLYDFMNTSQFDLITAIYNYNDKVTHQKLDNIQRQLSTLIYQNQQIILNQSIQQATLESMQSQNDEMIKYAIATEANTAIAAQYSQIAATHTEEVAYLQKVHIFMDLLR